MTNTTTDKVSPQDTLAAAETSTSRPRPQPTRHSPQHPDRNSMTPKLPRFKPSPTR